MPKPIIEVENLGKCYRIGANREKYLSLRDELARNAHGFYRRFLARHHQVPNDEEFWALKDVRFFVNEGEAVGIIGRNGAGKSTLLKILSKITPPTNGKITMRGRMASLLEVGTGFHPELSGRENIYLNGAILGMTRTEIRNKFDEIVAFSEVEKFLDTPVKRYSSGMYVRLAFAVAAHLEPEILIVDEVLAVGDAEFQKKCLGKMNDVTKAGRTVLFVSHNMAAIGELCKRSIWLANGTLVGDGDSQEIISSYLMTGSSAGKVDLIEWKGDRQGPGPLRLTSLETFAENSQRNSVFKTGDSIEFRIRVQGSLKMGCVIGLSIRDRMNTLLLHLSSLDKKIKLSSAKDVMTITVRLTNMPLNDGNYFVTVWLGDHHNHINDRAGNCLLFTVDNSLLGMSHCESPIRMQGDWAVLTC